MTVPKWMYPKDLLTFKNSFHLLIIAVLFEIMWLVTGSLFPQYFGFAMPPLTLDLIIKTIISPMTVIIWLIVGLSDILAHSILKIN